jgi:septum formation protein
MIDVAVYLASQSPRRAELLEQIGVSYSVLKVDTDETPLAGEQPLDYVQRVALEKARSGWRQSDHRRPVIGADTAGVLAGRLLCKPKDRDDGLAMLRAMSGKTHQILSAVAVVYGGREQLALSCSEVRFKRLSEQEIIDYWDTGEPVDKAGAYGIQGQAAVFVEHLQGSYSGVMGLPLAETYQLLQQFSPKQEQAD